MSQQLLLGPGIPGLVVDPVDSMACASPLVGQGLGATGCFLTGTRAGTGQLVDGLGWLAMELRQILGKRQPFPKACLVRMCPHVDGFLVCGFLNWCQFAVGYLSP